MLVAALMNIPTVAFEPNVVPGFANRLLAPTIRAAAVHFEQTCHYFRNCHVTGVPVRREFFNVPPRPKDAQSDAAGIRRQPGSACHQSRRARCPAAS